MLTDLPNLLTISRIVAVPLVIALAAVRRPEADLAACLVFTAAAVTDYLDGRIARHRRQFSEFGRMLDPIADKLLVGATLMILAGEGQLGRWSLFPAIVILLREILVSGLREYLAGLSVGLPVTPLAKWKTTAQMAALGLLLAGDPAAHLIGIGAVPVTAIGMVLLWIAAGLTLVTGWGYVEAGLSHVMPVPSLPPRGGSGGRAKEP
ncbi:MAG: CDP-diacylglycerol--glycerol-3-phosphate 3-phosphatidyltransferase [Acetobacteraceae bacterium]